MTETHIHYKFSYFDTVDFSSFGKLIELNTRAASLDVIDTALDDDEEDSVEVCEVEKETHSRRKRLLYFWNS